MSAFFLGGISYSVRVLDSLIIMVKLFLSSALPFPDDRQPLQDNFGETPLIIFQRPRLPLKLVCSSHQPPLIQITPLILIPVLTNNQDDDD